MNFDDAFATLIGHEGGFVNHPRDPGGKTKYGISNRSYPGEDIEGMTLERAKEIYRRDYWSQAGCEMVPDGAKFSLFDMAVNSGAKAAIKCVQRACGAAVDGVLGTETLMRLQAMPSAQFIARFNGHRLQFMSSLPTWPEFGRGWSNRIAHNLIEA